MPAAGCQRPGGGVRRRDRAPAKGGGSGLWAAGHLRRGRAGAFQHRARVDDRGPAGTGRPGRLHLVGGRRLRRAAGDGTGPAGALAHGGGAPGGALRFGVHGSFFAGAGRIAGWPSRGHPLEVCHAVAAVVPETAGAGRRVVRARRALLQLGRCYRRHGPLPEPGGGGPWQAGVVAGGQGAGDVPAPARWPAAIQRRAAGPAGAGRWRTGATGPLAAWPPARNPGYRGAGAPGGDVAP
ncbi:hypothetical protein D9M70_528480 [compost metagenome]